MQDRVERTVTVVNPLGLHARAAAQLVKLTSRLPCEVTLESEGQQVNGKSIMGVLMLAAAQGTQVLVTCTGERASESIEAIASLFAAGFHEITP